MNVGYHQAKLSCFLIQILTGAPDVPFFTALKSAKRLFFAINSSRDDISPSIVLL